MSDPLESFTGLLDRFTLAVESGDTAAFTALFGEDGAYDDIFYGEFRGHERLAEMLRDHFHAHARDFRWEMRDPVCDGRVGYASYTFSYTSTMKRSEGRRGGVHGLLPVPAPGRAHRVLPGMGVRNRRPCPARCAAGRSRTPGGARGGPDPCGRRPPPPSPG